MNFLLYKNLIEDLIKNNNVDFFRIRLKFL